MFPSYIAFWQSLKECNPMWFTFGLRSKWQALIWIDRKRWLLQNLMEDQSQEKSKSLIKENIPIRPLWLFVHHHLGSLTTGRRSRILIWLMNWLIFWKIDWLFDSLLNSADLGSDLHNTLEYVYTCKNTF